MTLLSPSLTRVTITWSDNAIQNEWLEMTLLDNGNTRLAVDDVFYFGNLIGEATGDGDAFDILETRNNPRPFPSGVLSQKKRGSMPGRWASVKLIGSFRQSTPAMTCPPSRIAVNNLE